MSGFFSKPSPAQVTVLCLVAVPLLAIAGQQYIPADWIFARGALLAGYFIFIGCAALAFMKSLYFV